MVSINALFLTKESEGGAEITDEEEQETSSSFIKASKTAYHKIKKAV